MNPSDIYKLLLDNLDKIESAIRIYQVGLKEEMEEVSTISAIRKELYTALHVSSKSAPVVSMNEYNRIKSDYEKLGSLISQKKSAITKIERIISEKQKEIASITKKLNELEADLNGGQILQFDTGKKKDESK